MKINDTAAIISGGNSGMGFAAAQALAAVGCRVTILGRRAGVVEKKAAQIGALGVACDISDEDSVSTALDVAERAHGVARILINTAADGRLLTLLNPDGSAASTAPMRQILDTNLLGTLLMCQAFASRLSRAGCNGCDIRGVVINVSSIGASDGVVGSAYAASKGAVDALTLSLAREFSPWRIRVMTIAPGGIDTEMFRSGAVPGTYEIIAGQTLGSQRIGRPEEFAALALHICENDYLNGSVIRLDSGMRMPFSFEVGGGALAPRPETA